MRLVLRWGWPASAAALLVFFAAAPLAVLACPWFVCAYAPTLLAAAGLGLFALKTGRRGGPLLLGAAGVFAVSMAAAALDGPLCDWIPIGTHWVWHLLNATALTLGTLALLRQVPVVDGR